MPIKMFRHDGFTRWIDDKQAELAASSHHLSHFIPEDKLKDPFFFTRRGD